MKYKLYKIDTKKNQEKLVSEIRKTIMSQVTKEIEFLKKLLFKIYKTVDAQFIIYVEKPEEKQNFALTITANASNLVYVVYKGANALNLVYLEHKAGIFLFSIASFISMFVFTYVTAKCGKVIS